VVLEESDFLLDDEPQEAVSALPPWQILVVDDEPGIHHVTALALSGVTFKDRPLELISAYSGAEALQLLAAQPDIAVILLDVVMETDDAGLRCVREIRQALGNTHVRIILRTGQPGQAPERAVISDYDINDYKEKTELTRDKLYVAVIGTLRSYDDLMTIERSRRVIDANRAGLVKIIDACSTIFRTQSIARFAQGVLEQLQALVCIDRETLFARASGIASLAGERVGAVVAATGRYADATGKDLRDAVDARLLPAIDRAMAEGRSVAGEDHFVGVVRTRNGDINLLVIDGPIDLSAADETLVELFCRNVGIAYDNLLLHDEMEETQREIVYRLGDLVETRSNETGNHVRRVAEISYLLALQLGLSDHDADVLRIASPMHDIGKIGIPDEILNKPGRLDPEEWATMQTHVTIGWNMTKDVKPAVWQAAATVALEHHERWDGTGYPQGLAGAEIHIMGRITALADVFDALTSRRIYKPAWPIEDVVAHIRAERGRHFDPAVVDAFFARFEEIDRIRVKYAD